MKDKQSVYSKPSFYTVMAVVSIAAVCIGFLNTFIIPVLSGSRTWPLSIYIHAAFAVSWLLLFLTQSILIQRRSYKAHMSLGRWSTLVALGASISIVPAALYQCERELREGLGQLAISSLPGAFTSSLIFLLLVVFAVVYRKRPPIHKRLMLLATIVLIWPAWFRWRHYFPTVQRPEIWFAVVLADSLIIVAFIWDWIKNRVIHPSLLFTGLLIMAEHWLEILLFDSSAWRSIANFIYKTIG